MKERYEAIRAAYDAIFLAGGPYQADITKIIGDAFDAGLRAQIDPTTDAGMWQALVAVLPDRSGKVTRYFRRHPKTMFALPPIEGEFVRMEEVEQRDLVIRWLDVDGKAPTLDHALRSK
jgi:hypothetical protein